MTVPSWSEVETRCVGVLPGGRYKPNSCVSESNVALVVPYRNREAQLRTFLKHIHPFLRNQFLNYRIVVVEMVRECSSNIRIAMNPIWGITWSYEELNSLVFNYAMYTTAKSTILHMTYNSKEFNFLYDNVI